MKENNDKGKNLEIDLIGMAQKVLAEKKLLGYFMLVFAIIGCIYAINQQKTYTATVSLAPEASGMGMSASLSDLAGMVGLDVGGSSGSVDAIYPDIYPEVLASSRFLVDLFDIQVKMKDCSTPKSYYSHIKEDTKIPFWQYPFEWLKNAIEKLTDKSKDGMPSQKGINLHHLTKEQSSIFEALRKNIGCQINKGTNIIYISVEDVDPLVSAAIADTVQKRLQEYIIDYRTQKARIDLEYALTVNKEAELAYIKARKEYAEYSDAHSNNVLTVYRAKESALENAVDLRFTTYSQTTAQVQKAQAKVQERTPAFTVIQEASVPLKASSTPRSIMVMFFIILGIISDSIWVLYLRDFIRRSRK